MNPNPPAADPERTNLRESSVDPAATVDASLDSTRPKLPPPPAGAPTVPGYHITDEIARGGMGVVYAAHHTTLDREVAIKTLLPGARADRFVVESKITAKLPHPNIPPVHELGELADGTPFLAMKYVHGKTLSVLLKARPNLRQELPRWVQVFEQIAQAVGFAHSRGIIHRDLKTLNVMVGEFGEVQVMDWGLARAFSIADLRLPIEPPIGSSPTVNGDNNPQSDGLTQAGTAMGTPGYMAPEQARGESVDARADVFALGAMLAAILTGKPAFVAGTANETISKAQSADLADVFARLEGCGADAELISVAKRCLSADQANRPADGTVVATEVAAYRAGVEARLRQAETDRAAAVVREGEQRKRRKQFYLAAGVVGAVLLAGLGLSLWQMTRAVTAEKATGEQLVKTQEAQAETAEQLQKTQEAKADAVEKLAYSERSNDVLGAVFIGLDPNANYATVGELRTALKEQLLRAVRELDGAAIGDPLVVAKMQNTLGVSLLRLGEPKLAGELFHKTSSTLSTRLGANHRNVLVGTNNLGKSYELAGDSEKAVALLVTTAQQMKDTLGPDHPDTLDCLTNLASAYQSSGKLDVALPIHKEAFDRRVSTLGPDHPDTLSGMNNLAGCYYGAGKVEMAIPLWSRALGLLKEKVGLKHPHTLTTMSNLGLAYEATGKLDLAVPLLKEAFAIQKETLGPEHPETLISMNNLAFCLRTVGDLKESVSLFEEAIKHLRATQGQWHPQTLRAVSNLAILYKEVGKIELALPMMRENLEWQKAKLGPDHPDTVASMNNLATGYVTAKNPELAIPLLEGVLKHLRKTVGPVHPNTLGTVGNLASAYQDLGKFDLALTLREETLEAAKAKYGDDHLLTLISTNNLVTSYRAAGKFELMLPLLEKTLERMTTSLGPDHPSTLTSMHNLAVGYVETGKQDKAITVFEDTLNLRRKKLGTEHPDTLATMGNLGGLYCKARQGDKAAPLLGEYVSINRKKFPKDAPAFAVGLAKAATDLLSCDQFVVAEEMLRESLAIREKKEPDAWTTFNTRSLLGAALLGQKKNADAEPLLVKGYEGMKEREKTMPKGTETRIPEALDRLVQLYTVTDKPDEIKKYKELRAKYPPAKEEKK